MSKQRTASPRQTARQLAPAWPRRPQPAWGWLDRLDGFDEARITAFVNAWRDRGPERTQE